MTATLSTRCWMWILWPSFIVAGLADTSLADFAFLPLTTAQDRLPQRPKIAVSGRGLFCYCSRQEFSRSLLARRSHA